MSVSMIEDFLRKLVSGEHYVDPKAYDNREQAAILRQLNNALFRYRVQKMSSIVPPPDVVNDTIDVIASAKAAGVVRTRVGEYSLRQPDKLEEESMLEILKNIQKQLSSGENVYNVQGNVYNVQGNVGEITTTYANTVKEIDDAKNIPEEKKSKLKQFLGDLKENSPTLLPIATELIKRSLGLP
jgi:hypothetical protein